MRIRPPALHIVWLLLAIGLAVSGVPRRSTAPDPTGEETWIVKLAEDQGLVLDDAGRLWDASGLEVPEWATLGRHLPGARIERLFQRPRTELEADRRRGEARTGRLLRDLSLYARITVPTGNGPDLLAKLRNALSDPDWIETAYPAPRPEPASIEEVSGGGEGSGTEGSEGGEGGGGGSDGSGGEGGSNGSGGDGRAPSFAHGQGYLGPAPDGIGALAVRGYPGGKGAGVRIVDIEGDWNWSHRDLPHPFLREGTTIPTWRNHGTAVLGQLVGRDDGRGIVGICPDAEVGTVSFLDFGVGAAIDLASASVGPGDILLIELHAPGPAEPEGPGQYGYLPMEWWQDCFDAIELATANGRIVVEAAGNGSQDLDHPRYRGLFDRNVRDSGAILVGAGTPWGRDAEWFTNHGSRVDLHGWGSAIITTGYGTLWDGAGEQDWYTAGFGGTSGAAPMVVGALANLQSMCRRLWNVDLDPELAAELLEQTGTPPASGARIGPRPDLVRARDALVGGIADVRGRVLGPEGAPIPAAVVRIEPGSRSVLTDDAGGFRVAVRASHGSLGPGQSEDTALSVRAAGFISASFPLDLDAGDYVRRDLVLSEAPHATCLGRVVTEQGVPVAEATVRALRTRTEGAPLEVRMTTTDSSGDFTLQDLPTNAEYWIVAGPARGQTGAAYRLALPPGGSGSMPVPNLVLGYAEGFEDGAEGWSADWPWRVDATGGFSGGSGWSLGPELYSGDLEVALVSPRSVLPHGTWLSFHHRYDFELGYDGGRVEIETGGDGAWIPLTPLEGYDVPNVAALGWEAGFSGHSSGWQLGLVDLSSFAGSEARIRFRFSSDESVSGTGWWIDDIGLHVLPEPSSSIPEGVDDLPGGVVGGVPGDMTEPANRLRALPNPFREGVELRIPRTVTGIAANAPGKRPAASGLRIIDTTGRVVRRLQLDGEVVTWDGRDQTGRDVPSGVYWVLAAEPGSVPAAEGGTSLPQGGHELLPEPLKLLRLR